MLRVTLVVLSVCSTMCGTCAGSEVLWLRFFAVLLPDACQYLMSLEQPLIKSPNANAQLATIAGPVYHRHMSSAMRRRLAAEDPVLPLMVEATWATVLSTPYFQMCCAARC